MSPSRDRNATQEHCIPRFLYVFILLIFFVTWWHYSRAQIFRFCCNVKKVGRTRSSHSQSKSGRKYITWTPPRVSRQGSRYIRTQIHNITGTICIGERESKCIQLHRRFHFKISSVNDIIILLKVHCLVLIWRTYKTEVDLTLWSALKHLR